jgi:pullulanase-type alpha-1,6-glucosidase
VDVIVPGVGLVRNRVTDPYALALTANSEESVVVDLADPALAPPGWRTRRAPAPVRAATDLVVYELHVRDFSIGDSTVPVAHRGRFLAFTDTASQGMRHLRALAEAGVTDLHLLPVFDIATIPERDCRTPQVSGQGADTVAQAQVMAAAATDCFNWGYDPFHYTVPEGSYATSVDDHGARTREFRQMVQALEGIGLRVGMDVVYNHMTQAGLHPQAVLDRLVPGYYQRLDSLGQVETSTCCSNTATEHRMMAKLMIESAVTWVQHYGITSFRFDLMGHQPRAAMERLQRAVNAAAGRHVPLIGEGWNFGEVADGRRFVQASQKSLGGSGIATFSDRARDAVRGGGCCDSARDLVLRQGWINGLSYAPNEAVQADSAARAAAGRAALATAADLVRVGLAGSLRTFRMQTADGVTRPLADIQYAGTEPAGYVQAPGEVVNYVENHDNQTLFDVNVMKLPLATSREDRARVQHLATAVVLLSQGIAYVHAGQEILRSKSLDRNSFDSGDWFNPLDWSYRSNGFARGLPPARDNRSSWPMMEPRLTRADVAPSAAEIRWTRDAFLDLLRIRRESPLLRLRTADDVARRVRFLNTGPAQEPAVVVGHLDGAGLDGADPEELLYAINVDTVAHRLLLPEVQGRPFVLHPVLSREGAADARVREAVWEAAPGALTVPARTVVVFVRRP